MDYPFRVHIETTGRCNASCKYCPHNISPRRFMGMSDRLFEKIIAELRTFPIKIHVTMMKLGEPFLDPKICDRLLMVDSLPNAVIEIHTNLNSLPPKVFRTLLSLDRLEYIWVSLNWTDAKKYQEQMGLNFNKTIENIKRLLATPLADYTVIGAVAIPGLTELDWAWWVTRNLPGAKKVKYIKKGDWCENIDASPNVIKDPICARLNEISICCDGKVALCCMDGLCEYELGDVNKEKLVQVFNSPRAKLYRTTPRAEIVPCKICTFE